ncbi:MAG: UDP-N-acetylmuramate dehydrogenase [Burkholderiales bacterium]|nr:UDP-N-acetylmuramate dehydrogenase [Burkholderiales bacterium]
MIVTKKRTIDLPMLDQLRGRIVHDLPLARYTRWRVGGSADIAFFPLDIDDLTRFLRMLPETIPLTLIGLGSNVLIRDRGVRGAVVLLQDIQEEPNIDQEGAIYAPGGLSTPKLARFAAQHHYIDAAFLVGIPGTVGGALAMNSGCYGDEIWRHVLNVNVLRRDGVFISRIPEEYMIDYRRVVLRPESGETQFEIFVGAKLIFKRDKKRDISENLAEIKRLLAKRAETQPQNVPNAGSVFRNPPNDYAGRLIEMCGLKGTTIGGAQISEKHANFIVNKSGAASAKDIETLIGLIQKHVREATGIELTPEIKIIGEAS